MASEIIMAENSNLICKRFILLSFMKLHYTSSIPLCGMWKNNWRRAIIPRGKRVGAVHKPNSVSESGYPNPDDGHSSGITVARYLMRPTRGLGRAALNRPPIWSCTRWGLHSFSGHPKNWCALTAPFHPYPADAGRFAFCCTFLHVTVTPRYGAPCPMVFGLSSGGKGQPATV